MLQERRWRILGCEGAGKESNTLDYQPVLDSIKSACAGTTTPVVRTFVVGTPGSEQPSLDRADGRIWLSRAAQAGGSELTSDCQNSGSNYCHFDMSTAANIATGFVGVLQSMIGQMLSCTFEVNDSSLRGQTVDSNKVSVIYQVNGSTLGGHLMLIGVASDPSCPEINGWYWDPSDPNIRTIQLCPTTCAMVHNDPGAVVDMLGGCTVGPIIN